MPPADFRFAPKRFRAKLRSVSAGKTSLDARAPRVGKPAFPILRWVGVVWLAVWIPAYWHAWGWQNFLHFCDVAVFLSCAGLWMRGSLLLSSQTLASLVPDAVWCLDAGWHCFTGHGLFGGTEYMWDPGVALWIRLLSLFHVALPCVLLYAVWKVGYDRRALLLQILICAALLVIARFFSPQLNLNYAYQEPLFHRAWGPAPTHLAAVLIFMSVVFYLPVHKLCRRFFRARRNLA
jgi:hypothetical protein